MSDHSFIQVCQEQAFGVGWRRALQEVTEQLQVLIDQLTIVGKDPSAPDWLRADSSMRLHGLNSAADTVRKLALLPAPRYITDSGGDNE
jgi:hypothetical protein